MRVTCGAEGVVGTGSGTGDSGLVGCACVGSAGKLGGVGSDGVVGVVGTLGNAGSDGEVGIAGTLGNVCVVGTVGKLCTVGTVGKVCHVGSVGTATTVGSARGENTGAVAGVVTGEGGMPYVGTATATGDHNIGISTIVGVVRPGEVTRDGIMSATGPAATGAAAGAMRRQYGTQQLQATVAQLTCKMTPFLHSDSGIAPYNSSFP